MGVFSKIGGVFSRYRNKFFVGSAVITGSVLLMYYIRYKLQDWQQKETKEYIERARKQQHFESTERTCNQTIISLLGALNDSLSRAIETEAVIIELQSNPDNKIELWDKLKVLVFTKVSCLIYIAAMLVAMLRIQMNVIGGYLYRDPAIITFEMQQKYLSLCHELLETGVEKLAEILKEGYGNILEVVPLKRQLKISDIKKIFWAIQMAVRNSDTDPIKNFKKYTVLADQHDEKSTYASLVIDTADLLDSDEVKDLTSSCINRGFVLLTDQIAEFYNPTPSKARDDFVHPADVKIPVAKLIPIINGLISKSALPDLLVQQLVANDKLKTLGANVYEAFS